MSVIKTQQFVATMLVSLVALLALSGCGFKLRGDNLLPMQLKVMQLQVADRYSELARLLKVQLVLNGVQLIDANTAAEAGDISVAPALLELKRDRLDRRTLSLFPNGQVAEHELIYSVRYSLTVDQQPAQTFDFEIYRDYQDDPESALAKSKELKLILKEMRQQAADKIIRQLASFTNDTTPAG